MVEPLLEVLVLKLPFLGNLPFLLHKFPWHSCRLVPPNSGQLLFLGLVVGRVVDDAGG